MRVVDDDELSKLIHKSKWADMESDADVKEWSDKKIANLLKDNVYFRKGLVNLFFEGATTSVLARMLPLFELKKLSISKLKFEVPAMIDTLVRYKEKGSYSGQAENNPEHFIAEILQQEGVSFEKGDLTELFKNEPIEKRTMDFIIPSKEAPRVIIESSFLVTTSSGQGDKSKTEGNIKKLISKYYPKAAFIGFVDGIGWYVRKKDLMRMVAAYNDVFTFHNDEIERFKKYLKKELRS